MIFDVADGLIRALSEEGLELGSVAMKDLGETIEVYDLKVTGKPGVAIHLGAKAFEIAGNKTVWLQYNPHNDLAADFYRRLIERGSLEIAYIVLRKPNGINQQNQNQAS